MHDISIKLFFRQNRESVLVYKLKCIFRSQIDEQNKQLGFREQNKPFFRQSRLKINKKGIMVMGIGHTTPTTVIASIIMVQNI